MKYFLHSLAIGFFAAAVIYKSWLLGLCSVMIIGILSAKEGYELYLQSKQATETLSSVRKIADAQAKLESKFDQWQSELGKISYKVNQFGDYLGSPRD